jgi:hypothetical protein
MNQTVGSNILLFNKLIKAFGLIFAIKGIIKMSNIILKLLSKTQLKYQSSKNLAFTSPETFLKFNFKRNLIIFWNKLTSIVLEVT